MLSKKNIQIVLLFFLLLIFVIIGLNALLVPEEDKQQQARFDKLSVDEISSIRIRKNKAGENEYYNIETKYIDQFCYSKVDIQKWQPDHPENPLYLDILLKDGYMVNLAIYFDVKKQMVFIKSYKRYGPFVKFLYKYKSNNLYNWFESSKIFEDYDINPKMHVAATPI